MQQQKRPTIRRAMPMQFMASDPAISADVAANAGTGKTQVLTQRVLRLLLAGESPSKILCLTYTKAAAAEMSERIGRLLETWVVLPEPELLEQLRNLLDRAPTAAEKQLARQLFAGVLNSMPPPRIQTIHSFCQEILQKFSLEAGVMPYFSVAADLQADEMRKKAKGLLLADAANAQLNKAIEYIAENKGESFFDEIIDEILAQQNKFKARFESFDAEGLVANFADVGQIFAQVGDVEPEFLHNFAPVIEAFPANKAQIPPQFIQSFLRDDDVESYAKIFIGTGNKPRKAILKKEGALKFAHLLPAIEAEQQRVVQVLEQVRVALGQNIKLAVEILAFNLLKTYDALKQQKNCLDYNDLIFFTCRLLSSSEQAQWVLYKLDGGIDHVLVDEAQDASTEQWQIIRAITDDFFAGETSRNLRRSLFVVGDEKQSIYGFQGADPKSFFTTTGLLRTKANAANLAWERIPLSMSFRTLPKILQFIDLLFGEQSLRVAISTADKIEHQSRREHKKTDGIVELWPLFVEPEYEQVSAWELPFRSFREQSAQAQLANTIADKIADWLKNGRILASEDRAVEAGDIIILLRKRGELSSLLTRKLKQRGVPVSGVDRMNLPKQLAVQDLLSLAEFCLLPQNDLALAEVLKSPLLGVSELDLFEICYGRAEKTVLQNLAAQPKFAEIFQKLQAFQRLAQQQSPYEFYNELLNNQNLRQNFVRRFGDEINDPLDVFLSAVLEFEFENGASLQKFILQFKSANFEIKRDMEAKAGQVRIMTAHAAKGLEAPIVFLVDVGDFKKKMGGQRIVWSDGDFAINSNIGDNSEEVKEQVVEQKDDEYQEYLRLLYVSLTRPRDEIYVCGAGKKVKGSWHELIEKKLEEVGERSFENFAEGVLRFGSLQYEFAKPVFGKAPESAVLPAFMMMQQVAKNAPQENFDKILTSDNFAMQRGKKLHKFFEHYEHSKAAIVNDLAREFLQDEQLISEALQVLQRPEFAEIFAENALAEASFVYRDELGMAQQVQIDRMIVSESAVLVVDFKTGAKTDKYAPQLQKYAEIVQRKWPAKKVSAKILWTELCQLEDVALTF